MPILPSQLRQHIAQATARLIVQEGIHDYQLAKQKAAAQLGVADTKHLPSNSEIEEEIILYNRLFNDNAHTSNLTRLRHVALKAMRLFEDFSPRLVGSVLSGTAPKYADVTLHVFANSPEEIAFFLLERDMPYELSERCYRLPQNPNACYPCYTFIAGEDCIMLIVFGVDDVRWSPPSPDGKSIKRASIKAVEKLIKGHCDE